MATIGNFERSEDGNYQGVLNTLTIDKKVSIEKIEKTNDRAPDYRIFALSDKTDAKSDIGAGWLKESQAGNQYMQVSIDSPDLQKPINGALFSREDGKADMVWERPKEQSKAMDRADKAMSM